MLEFIIFLIAFTTVTAFSIIIIRLKNINLQLLIAIDQSIKDIEYLQSQSGDNVVEKEHLLSFLNETREIAYKYIEDLHKALVEYRDEISYDLENPNDLSIMRFRKAFEKLEKMYPKDVPND